MNLLGETKLPSVINDPFKKTKVTQLSVTYTERFLGTGFYAYGSVTFKNGNTEGKQSFEADTFDDVVLKIKAMLSTLE